MPSVAGCFRKRATCYRALLRKITYKDKASYASSPPCTWRFVGSSSSHGESSFLGVSWDPLSSGLFDLRESSLLGCSSSLLGSSSSEADRNRRIRTPPNGRYEFLDKHSTWRFVGSSFSRLLSPNHPKRNPPLAGGFFDQITLLANKSSPYTRGFWHIRSLHMPF